MERFKAKSDFFHENITNSATFLQKLRNIIIILFRILYRREVQKPMLAVQNIVWKQGKRYDFLEKLGL